MFPGRQASDAFISVMQVFIGGDVPIFLSQSRNGIALKMERLSCILELQKIHAFWAKERKKMKKNSKKQKIEVNDKKNNTKKEEKILTEDKKINKRI